MDKTLGAQWRLRKEDVDLDFWGDLTTCE